MESGLAGQSPFLNFDWQLKVALSAPNFLIYDSVSRQPCLQAIADIKMVSLVNSQSTWAPAANRNKNKIENPALVQQE